MALALAQFLHDVVDLFQSLELLKKSPCPLQSGGLGCLLHGLFGDMPDGGAWVVGRTGEGGMIGIIKFIHFSGESS
ncbi:hypothetical protein ACS0TY_021247 [Phlomoides rotata]